MRICFALLPHASQRELFPRANQVAFDSSGAVLIPGITNSATSVSFIAQGAPSPVKAYDMSAGCHADELCANERGFRCDAPHLPQNLR